MSIFSETSPLAVVVVRVADGEVLLLLQDELYAQYSRGSLHSLHVSTAVADGCLVHADKTIFNGDCSAFFPVKMTEGESTKEDKDEECDDDLITKKELTTTLLEATKIHATTFDQSFESILHVEQECIEIGFQSGQSDGEAKGFKEGESIGFLEAFAIGSEVGHYLGALRVWEREFSSSSPDGMTTTTTNLEERKKERIRMALGQLETALGDIVASGWIGDDKDGTTKEGTDTNLDEDFTEKLERARACFRKCTASLGVHGKYKGFAEEEEVAKEDGDNTFARDDAF